MKTTGPVWAQYHASVVEGFLKLQNPFSVQTPQEIDRRRSLPASLPCQTIRPTNAGWKQAIIIPSDEEQIQAETRKRNAKVFEGCFPIL
jgi:hypothetical protein